MSEKFIKPTNIDSWTTKVNTLVGLEHLEKANKRRNSVIQNWFYWTFFFITYYLTITYIRTMTDADWSHSVWFNLVTGFVLAGVSMFLSLRLERKLNEADNG